MSRIGKKSITIPSGVTFNFANNKVSVKGPKGELHQAIDPDFKIKNENGTVTVERPTEQKRHKAMHGLYRALIANMVEGVSKHGIDWCWL
jgi:large subunit ribosomal protein L6